MGGRGRERLLLILTSLDPCLADVIPYHPTKMMVKEEIWQHILHLARKVPFLSSLLKSSLLTDPFSCTKYTRKRVNFTLLCVTITQINLNRQMLNKLCAKILQRRDVSFLQPKGTIVDPISRRPSSLFNRTNYIIPQSSASD